MDQSKHFKFIRFFAVIALFITQTAFAANFSITPLGTLPTTISAGQTVSAYYTVTNMTNTVRTGYTFQGFPTTVTQNTTAPNCSSTISLAPNASCLLQLDITGAVSANFAICKGNSCTAAMTPLNVSLNTSTATAPRFAYVTQDNALPQILVCPVNSLSGSIIAASCVNADSTSSLPSIFAQGIVVNNAGTVAYISTGLETPYVYQCPIDHNTGLFSSGCTATMITSPAGYDPYYGKLALSPDNTYAYFSDYNTGNGLRVLNCPIIGGVISASCSINSTGNGIILNSNVTYGSGITVNKNNSMGYAGLYNDSIGVAVCPITNNIWNTAATTPACLDVNGDGTITLDDTTGVAFNPDQSILYIATTNATVYGCNPTLSGSNFASCFVAATGFDYSWGIIVNSQNTFAYVTDYTDSIYACPINSNGTFATCTQATGFTAPVDVALLY